MIQIIKKAMTKGDTLGGKIKVVAENVPIGLGSHTQWDMKLDGRLAQSLMSIQAVKAVEFGMGTEFAGVFGSDAHDEIFIQKINLFTEKQTEPAEPKAEFQTEKILKFHAQ